MPARSAACRNTEANFSVDTEPSSIFFSFTTAPCRTATSTSSCVFSATQASEGPSTSSINPKEAISDRRKHRIRGVGASSKPPSPPCITSALRRLSRSDQRSSRSNCWPSSRQSRTRTRTTPATSCYLLCCSAKDTISPEWSRAEG